MKHNPSTFNEVAALRRAYMTLLELPQGATRLRMQTVLSELRDAIAETSGTEPQEIQDAYEAWVRDNPERICPFATYRR